MFNQWTELEAIQPFTMKLQRGRPCHVKQGDVFVVTNPKHMQGEEGIKIMRKKNARLNDGYLLTMEQVNQLFQERNREHGIRSPL